ncbi:MAG TPA: polysaccharide deacetylase family protein, partial [Patescibacteria group bacterium]|nr:polysaccharide deacetylase family protein [Patescibacteria group bacterium]
VGSKQDLERLLGHSITAFAYPYGSWSFAIAKEVERAGYTLAFGVRLGSLHTDSSRFQLRRIRVLDGEALVPLLDQFSESE